EMYSTPICPYCMRAKSLLQHKGLSYTDINVMTDPKKRAEMVQRSGGGRTVPQIFIDGKPIGGCDEMFGLEADGELDVLLGFK
ncbi:MAG: glutaredoxin 3, partial [Magnetovibrio sp.]|nr:glutaredoxin 3 [Magnetovibrio sp.]